MVAYCVRMKLNRIISILLTDYSRSKAVIPEKASHPALRPPVTVGSTKPFCIARKENLPTSH